MNQAKGDQRSVLLIAMPFALLTPPSAQLAALEAYLAANGIRTESRNHYLTCGNMLGLNCYNEIAATSSFIKNILYSKFLFPEYYEENKEKLELIIENQRHKLLEQSKDFPTADVIFERLRAFNERLISETNWDDYDYVGFTINYSQLLPSVYIARNIKMHHPNVKIVFGGYSISGGKGMGVMKAFPCVDFVISGEGEQSLLDLVRVDSESQLADIGGLYYRKGEDILFNEKENYLDMNSLPYYRFDGYFDDLKACTKEIVQYCEINFTFPIETSRGCWWNKCNFCSYCSIPNQYRIKSPKRVRDEIEHLSNKHNIVSLFFLDEAMSPKDVRKLFNAVNEIDKELLIFSIGRAQRLSAEDIKSMYNAGVTAHQVGVESFSSNLLKKMNKGTTAIENIQIIKQLLEVNIYPSYTLITDFPYQDKQDFEETVHVLSYLKGFPEPAASYPFELHYGSQVYNNYRQFNIQEYAVQDVDQLSLPPDIAKTLTFPSYAFTMINSEGLYLDEFKKAINKFSDEVRELRESAKGKPLLYYKDGGTFLSIFDYRYSHKRKYILDKLERDLYLYCDTIKSRENIANEFNSVSPSKIDEILNTFDDHKIMYSENGEYISLAIRHRFPIA